MDVGVCERLLAGCAAIAAYERHDVGRVLWIGLVLCFSRAGCKARLGDTFVCSSRRNIFRMFVSIFGSLREQCAVVAVFLCHRQESLADRTGDDKLYKKVCGDFFTYDSLWDARVNNYNIAVDLF